MAGRKAATPVEARGTARGISELAEGPARIMRPCGKEGRVTRAVDREVGMNGRPALPARAFRVGRRARSGCADPCAVSAGGGAVMASPAPAMKRSAHGHKSLPTVIALPHRTGCGMRHGIELANMAAWSAVQFRGGGSP